MVANYYEKQNASLPTDCVKAVRRPSYVSTTRCDCAWVMGGGGELITDRNDLCVYGGGVRGGGGNFRLGFINFTLSDYY